MKEDHQLSYYPHEWQARDTMALAYYFHLVSLSPSLQLLIANLRVKYLRCSFELLGTVVQAEDYVLKKLWNVKSELIDVTWAWDNWKKKIWVPSRNQTHDFPNTGRVLYLLSYENSYRVRSLNWADMWQASCILQGTALSKSSWVVISEYRWWILSLVMKCEKWTDQHDMSMRQRKNLSPQQEINLWPPAHQAGTLSTEATCTCTRTMESKVI